MADPFLSSLSEQSALVPLVIREAIGKGLREAQVSGFVEFNGVLLDIVGHALGGNITPEQVKAVTPLLELLFASISAQVMRQDALLMRRVDGDPDPTAAFLDSAAKRGKKLRPVIEMSDTGEGIIEMEATLPNGQKVTVDRQRYQMAREK